MAQPTIGGTGLAGDNARLFPWQVSHYLVRGGPNDPVLQTTPAGATPTGGGYLSWNSVVTLPPVPGTQNPPNVPLPRSQSLNSGGAVAAAVLGTAANPNNGGIWLGTIPQGAYIVDFQIQCYASLAGGTSTSIGLFYVPSNQYDTRTAPGFQPEQMFLLGYITSPTANNIYSARGTAGNYTAFTALGTAPGPLGLGNSNGAVFNGSIAATALTINPPPGVTPLQVFSGAIATGQNVGGNGVTDGTTISSGSGLAWVVNTSQTVPAEVMYTGSAAMLASVCDIDIYMVGFLVAGGGTANTGGSYGAMIEFTGLEG